jgi:hypothetical protein
MSANIPEPAPAPLTDYQAYTAGNESYFDLKPFETPQLYDRLGVGYYERGWKAFNRGCVSVANFILRDKEPVTSLDGLNLAKGDMQTALEARKVSSAVTEKAHLIGAVGLNAIFAATEVVSVSESLPASATIGALSIFTTAQLAINAYPIMLQRRTRARIERVQQRRYPSQPTED